MGSWSKCASDTSTDPVFIRPITTIRLALYQLVLAEIATASHYVAGDRRLLQSQLNIKQLNVACFQEPRVSPWFDLRKVFKADHLTYCSSSWAIMVVKLIYQVHIEINHHPLAANNPAALKEEHEAALLMVHHSC